MHQMNTPYETPLARVRVEADDDTVDDSFLDTWGLEPNELAKERAALWSSIERDGVWGFVAEWRPSPGATWRHVDSCWGFVGDIPEDELAEAFAAAKREVDAKPCTPLDPSCS